MRRRDFLGAGLAAPLAAQITRPVFHGVHVAGGIPRTGLVQFLTFGVDAGLTGDVFSAWANPKRNGLKAYTDLSGTSWTRALVTCPNPDAITAPDGTQTAEKLVESTDAAPAFHNVYQAFVFQAGVYTFSAYVKADERAWIWLRTNAVGGVYKGGYFDVANGLRGGWDPEVAATITSEGSGWYRVAISFTASAGSYNVMMTLASANLGGNYQGNGTSGLVAWGPQVNPGTTPLAREQATDQSRIWDWSGNANHAARGSGTAAPTFAIAGGHFIGLSFDAGDQVTGLTAKGANWTVINGNGTRIESVDSAGGSYIDGVATPGATEYNIGTVGGYAGGTATFRALYNRVLPASDQGQFYREARKLMNLRRGLYP